MTVEKCKNHCFGKNYRYAGVQNHQECYCGNSISSGEPRPDSECNKPCSGNKDQMCGGAYRLNIYERETSSTTEGKESLILEKKHFFGN